MMQADSIYDCNPRYVLMCALIASRYTGKERDSESGLDYFGARYYSSSMGRFSSPDPSGLYYADPANPQSLNLYSYVGNNPLIFTDPSGMDCVYTNNQTSNSVSVTTVRGDCLSDTDSGVYVNGTVNTSSYTYSGTSLGYQYSPDDAQGGTTTLGSGTIGLDAPAAQASIDPDNARINALVQGVAQNTAGFPNICSMSFSARGQIPFTPVKAGFSMDGQGKLSGSASWKQAGGSGSPSVSLTGRANTNGGAVAQQLSVPIPDTPFSATLGVNPLGGRNSYGVSADLGKGFAASAAATFGTMGDPGCQKR
jgi:RHS repeat-associated protein